MMAKRKSIGNDPLDWIGEPSGGAAGAGGANGTPPSGDRGAISTEPLAAGGLATSAQLALPEAPTALALERQLLLVDGMFRDVKVRPRINRTLWAALLVVAALGMAVVLFQEARRQWAGRVLALEGEVTRIEREKGRSEEVLERLLLEKDGLIREKQGTIARFEALNQGVSEELRLARAEARRLQEETQALLSRLLVPAGKPADEGKKESAHPGEASAPPRAEGLTE